MKFSIYAGRALSGALLWCGNGERSNKLATLCDRYPGAARQGVVSEVGARHSRLPHRKVV